MCSALQCSQDTAANLQKWRKSITECLKLLVGSSIPVLPNRIQIPELFSSAGVSQGSRESAADPGDPQCDRFAGG